MGIGSTYRTFGYFRGSADVYAATTRPSVHMVQYISIPLSLEIGIFERVKSHWFFSCCCLDMVHS